MFASLLILLVLPITDLSRTRGNEFKPFSKFAFWSLVAVFFVLLQIGSRHAEAPYILVGQLATFLYFSNFALIVPGVSLLENTLSDLKESDKNSMPLSFTNWNRSKLTFFSLSNLKLTLENEKDIIGLFYIFGLALFIKPVLISLFLVLAGFFNFLVIVSVGAESFDTFSEIDAIVYSSSDEEGGYLLDQEAQVEPLISHSVNPNSGPVSHGIVSPDSQEKIDAINLKGSYLNEAFLANSPMERDIDLSYICNIIKKAAKDSVGIFGEESLSK